MLAHPYLVALILSCLMILWKALSEWPTVRRLDFRDPAVRMWTIKQALSLSISVMLIFEVWIGNAEHLTPLIERMDLDWWGRLCSFLVFLAAPLFLFPPALDRCQKWSLQLLNALAREDP
ncbi:hypothetical protein HF670_11915 [Acidithiobacillus thiooxidans]|nr:hypothetical protein [Acidithiobacillus thiooxidans]MBU2836956.1 hypothetical protein [Acidithiobacillus thiooxidans]MBU2840252.1 hypothetical protein [Acidithiobacillus thiooxidans]OCX68194.1 hypothetical protein A6M23_18855 [Acidithiobacillus thiooxidans]OCX82295.1 hypothetical protein A6P08_12255 [Acidithiobacillus thiooxidans]